MRSTQGDKSIVRAGWHDSGRCCKRVDLGNFIESPAATLRPNLSRSHYCLNPKNSIKSKQSATCATGVLARTVAQSDALRQSLPRPSHTCPASLRASLALQRPPFTAYPVRALSVFTSPPAIARANYFPNGRSAQCLLSAPCHLAAEQCTEKSLNCRFGKIRQRPFRSTLKLTLEASHIASCPEGPPASLPSDPELATSTAPRDPGPLSHC